MEIKIKTHIEFDIELTEVVNKELWEKAPVGSKTLYFYFKIKDYINDHLKETLDETKITWEIV